MSRKMSTLALVATLVTIAATLMSCAPVAAPAPAAPAAAQEAAPTEAVAAEPTAAEAAPAEAAPAEAAPEGGKKFKGQLVISTNGADPEDGRYIGLIEAYKKVQPDVEIIVEGPPAGTDYTPWLGTQLAAGDVRPDIVSGNYQKTYGKYVNLDKYRFSTNPYTGKTWDEDLDWNFFEDRNAKGERTMLASEAVHILWFYNKDLFAKAGIEPPATWDDMAAACDKLLAAGITPLATNYVWKLNQWIPEIYWDQYYREVIDIIRAKPGDYNYDDEKDGKNAFDIGDRFPERKFNMNPSRYYAAIRDGQIKWDTPETAEVTRQLARIFPKCSSPSLFVDTTEYSQFMQGKVAMMIDGTWSLPGLTRNMAKLEQMTVEEQAKLVGAEKLENKLSAFQWGIFENPGMTGPLVKSDVRSIESASGIYVSVIDKNAEQTEMAVDLAMFWLSQPGYQAWVDGGLKTDDYDPTGPLAPRGVKLPADLQAMIDSIQFLGNVEFVPIPFSPMRIYNIESLDQKGLQLFKDALEGTITPEAFATEIQKLWDDNFDEIISKAGLTQEDLDNPERDPSQ
jgi:raffinose/stachyose/melibiose transport system substrate-binding protein